MKENNLEMLKIHEEMLVEQNRELKARNEFLERQVNALKLNNQALTRERNDLVNRLNNVSIWDLSDEAQEEAGHMLAKALLGGK